METATMGHNNPPEPTLLEAHTANILDLFETAQGFLDGEPIANEETAALVNKLINDALEAKRQAEAQRKKEAKPFDDGKKEVQAKWTPLTADKTGKCDLIVSTARKALQPWLLAKEAEQLAAAEKAREEAVAAQEKALAAHRAAQAKDDLAVAEQAEELRKAADIANAAANRAEKARPTAKGGARASGLVSTWSVELTDPLAFGRWLWANRQDEYIAMLETAAADFKQTRPPIPGLVYHESRDAR